MFKRVTFAISVMFITVLFSLGYIFTDGYRDYKKYCSGYISDIESYKSSNGSYPKILDSLKEPNDVFGRYQPKDCGYQRSEGGYVFYAPSAFGVVMYFSKEKHWVYD